MGAIRPREGTAAVEAPGSVGTATRMEVSLIFLGEHSPSSGHHVIGHEALYLIFILSFMEDSTAPRADLGESSSLLWPGEGRRGSKTVKALLYALQVFYSFFIM